MALGAEDRPRGRGGIVGGAVGVTRGTSMRGPAGVATPLDLLLNKPIFRFLATAGGTEKL